MDDVRRQVARAIAPDPVRRGLWLGFFQEGLTHFTNGRVESSYGAAEGVGSGAVASLFFDTGGTLWMATESGLSRLRDGTIATLTTKNGLPCDAVHWVIEDDLHALWLYTACGLVESTAPT